jgi:hypothetical protein
MAIEHENKKWRRRKGAKPGDLAVGGKQLVINLKTAKALGMNVDASDLQGAKIIE